MTPEIGQVWLDNDRKWKPRRRIRITQVSRREGITIVNYEARQGDEPWYRVIRFIRADRLVKRFTLEDH